MLTQCSNALVSLHPVAGLQYYVSRETPSMLHHSIYHNGRFHQQQVKLLREYNLPLNTAMIFPRQSLHLSNILIYTTPKILYSFHSACSTIQLPTREE